MAYVYQHIRLDKSEVFYIGIGSDSKYKRANTKSGRNNLWKKIVDKTLYNIEILYDDITWEAACLKEKELILQYGQISKRTGTLCNFTSGGEGTCGISPSIETREKIAKLQRGVPKNSEKFKLYLSKINSGINHPQYGKSRSIKTRDKIRNSRKGGKNYNAKKVLNQTTGIIYECVRDIPKEVCSSYQVLLRRLRGVLPNNTNFVLI